MVELVKSLDKEIKAGIVCEECFTLKRANFRMNITPDDKSDNSLPFIIEGDETIVLFPFADMNMYIYCQACSKDRCPTDVQSILYDEDQYIPCDAVCIDATYNVDRIYSYLRKIGYNVFIYTIEGVKVESPTYAFKIRVETVEEMNALMKTPLPNLWNITDKVTSATDWDNNIIVLTLEPVSFIDCPTNMCDTPHNEYREIEEPKRQFKVYFDLIYSQLLWWVCQLPVIESKAAKEYMYTDDVMEFIDERRKEFDVMQRKISKYK